MNDYALETLRGNIILHYVNVICLTLCVYEYMCTFSKEVSVIWKAGWNIPKVIYLIIRWAPLILLSAMLCAFERDCGMYTLLFSCGTLICKCVSEAIFALRLWAIWDRTHAMAIILSILFSVEWIGTFIVNGHIWVRYYLTGEGCVHVVLAARLPMNFYSLIAMPEFYFITLLLTLTKAYIIFVKRSGTAASLMKIVHLDGKSPIFDRKNIKFINVCLGAVYSMYLFLINSAIIGCYFGLENVFWVDYLMIAEMDEHDLEALRGNITLQYMNGNRVRFC
ncbi:hypothetical protein D9615_006685 [Tricholomella constricta]|uniref:DUF6533 domain-containing protein n=1 Tax=Tricholomella constricta TaxID=117010 RepID=A0A8H5H743_9AGAR|nr:hypothetical protein D9615_006685 [Tricholomella constricta]